MGNTRVLLEVVENDLVDVQHTDYYPFGLSFENNNLNRNKYLYGGKEYQDAVLGGRLLSFYDFGSRYYDSEIGRWFNIDPALQMVGPYSYCNNNPICYIDPDGEWIHIAIGALVGGIINVVTHWDEIGSFKDGLAAFGIGAVAGAVGAATGGVAFAGAGGAAAVLGSGGFLAGMAGGAAGTAFSMPLESLGNSLYFGDPFMTGSDYVLGVAGGGLLGGLINGGASVIKGQNFWNGSVSPSNVSTPRSSPKLDYELPQNKVVELPSTVSPAEIPDLPQPRLAPVPEKVYLTLDPELGGIRGNYSVYYGADKVTNEIKYIGITGREPQIRFGEHLRALGTGREKLKYAVIPGLRGLSETSARIMEQRHINFYDFQKNGGTLLNKKNSLAPKYWKKYGIIK